MKLTNNLYSYPEKGMLDCNTYVVKGTPGIIVDPGSVQFLPALLQDLGKDGISLEDIGMIINTHLHLDHSWADEAFKEASGAKIIFHSVQKESYDVTVVKTTRFFGLQPISFREDSCFESDRLDTGDMEFELIHAPGHSPDSICYYCPRDKILICGDVLFDHNTGRLDLPGGNADELRKSIERLTQLEIEYLLPGHMGIVTGTTAVKSNFEFIKENILKWL
ncbi:MBL fold metallo-hydrolase [Chloroflexota bacterium]